jgi:PAS domain S-box-containing protein
MSRSDTDKSRLSEQQLLARVAELEQRVRELESRAEEFAARETDVERFDLVLQVTNSAIWDWDLRTGELWRSPGHEALFGRGGNEVVRRFDPEETDQLWSAQLHPDDHDRVKQRLRDHLEKNTPYDVEYRYRLPSDEYIWIRSVGRAVRDSDGKPVRMIGSNTGITRQKLAEQESERIREAMENASEGIVLYDADDRFVYANKRYRELFHEITDLLVPGARRKDVRNAFYAAGAILAAVGEEEKFKDEMERQRDSGERPERQHSSGTWIQYSDHSLPDGSVVSIRTDITDIKNREAQLRESEQFLGSVLDNVADSVVTMDETGVVLSFNQAAELTFGYRAEEVIGGKVERLMPAPYAAEHDDYIARYLTTGHARILGKGAHEVEGRHSDGTTFPIELAISEMRIGGKRNFIGAIRDITARKQVEDQLRQAQKMEAVGQLTGGVAHDFNNLLAVILGNLDLIGGRVGDDPKIAEMIERGVRAAERGAALTDRLLAYSRKQNLMPTVIDFNALLDDNEDMLRRTLGEHIEIDIAKGAGLWPSQVDRSQLENALLNLAINARDAIKGGGRMTIETANIALEATDAAAAWELAPGRYVMLRVSDTGAGIAEDKLRHVFEPFFTTKEVGKGSGLGLSMVHGFAKQSGGNVTIESEPGAGTTVTLYLPAGGKGEPAAETHGDVHRPANTQGETVRRAQHSDRAPAQTGND